MFINYMYGEQPNKGKKKKKKNSNPCDTHAPGEAILVIIKTKNQKKNKRTKKKQKKERKRNKKRDEKRPAGSLILSRS